jgi:hypothetical protein
MRALTLFLLAIVAQAAAAQQKVDIHMRAIPVPSVRLGGAVSSVRVIGWDRDSIALTGALSQGSRMDGGPFGGSTLVVGMKFFIDAPDESALRGNKLELRVPRNARVWIKGGSADIDASGINGGLDLNIVGGSARVACSPAELQVESMDGSVTIEGSPAWLRAKTATGDIVMRGGSDDAGMSTVSGTVRVGEGRFERVKFTSVTGPIVFAGDLARGATLDFDTHSGPIELRLMRTLDAEVDLATVTGTIENTLNGRRPIAGREGRGMELGFTSGIGRARILARSFKGNIHLRPR